MFKKLLIGILALVGTISAVYVVDIQANDQKITIGGALTGRINIPPSGISGDNIGLQKGDKVLLGVKNPEDGSDLGWQLKYLNRDYKYYTLGNKCDYTFNTCNIIEGEPITAWYTMTNESIGNTTMFDSMPEFDFGAYSSKYMTSNTARIVNQLNTNLTDADKQIIKDRDLEAQKKVQEQGITNVAADNIGGNYILLGQKAELGKKAFTPSHYEIFLDTDANMEGNYATPQKDYTSENGCWLSENLIAGSKSLWFFRLANGGRDFDSAAPITSVHNINPALYLDLKNVVFSVSMSNDNGIGKVSELDLSSDYTSLWEETRNYANMKMRIQNSFLTANLIGITNKGVPIQKTTAGTEVTLSVDANAGNDGGTGVNTISVIVFDENNNFKYYKPLAVTQDGEQDYVFDTTGMEPGNYKISVVNEVYDETSTSPADSSLISEPIDFTVVEPLSNVQASDGTFTIGDPEVVDNGQVSTITSTGGAEPITYTLVSDEIQAGHENDYQYFEVSGNQILVNTTDGLDAGDYYFKVQAFDANGDPDGGIVSNTVHIRVNKKKLTIVFDVPEQTEKTINELQSGWSETATATPSAGTKVTYRKISGKIGLIEIDADTGMITQGSETGYGKVTIQAIADDDPSTGKDNYEESEPATKEILIVQEVDGVIEPDKASSDETIPTFEADEANIKTGGTIGHVVGRLGTPDNGESGTTTYYYELVEEGDHYIYFAVDRDSGEITTKADLPVGTYQFKVKVSDQWTSKEISVEVRVREAVAEELSFYDPDNTSTKITKQTATIGDTGVHVLAQGENESNTNPITYSIKDGSSNVITVNQTSGAVTIHGVGTVTVVARKQGMSGQAEAVAELTFTVEQGEQDFIFTDEAENQLPTSGTNYLPYEEVYGKGKEFQLYTDGAVDGAQITYRLKSGSPTDVITVSSSGLVHILNANLNSQIGKVIVEATSHDPSGNYADKTIELPIQINKATQSVSFKDNPIYVESGSGSVEPIIEATDTSNEDGSIPDSEYIVSVSGDEYAGIAWSNDGKTIEYDHDGDRISIPLLVSKAGNRNYEATSEVSGTLTILGPDETIFAISSPGKVTYGDVFEIRSLQDDSSSSNVQYAFEVGDTAYISDPTVTGNKASFEAIQASGNQMITIKVTRTADHEMTLTKTISIKVWPKDVEIEVEDKTKKEGEVNPALTYVDFDDQLVRNDVIAQQDIRLSTTATTNSGAGSYPITVDVAYLNQKYPNYNFTQNTGTLTITNDVIDSSWMHLETADGQRYNSVWTNQNVYLVSDSVVYQDISLNKQTWANRVEVNAEGNHTYDFWMKSTSGAITSKGVTSAIKIDKTDPVINDIRVLQASRNAYESFMNTISFGVLYGNQKTIQVQATDPILGGVNEVSNIAEITYTLQKLDANLLPDGNPTTGKLSGNDREISVSGSGMHEVCAIAYDNAGNASSEHCEQVDLGMDESIDSNQNGCQDLNIEMPDGSILNEDVNRDGIPELNIDTDMDGKADINIDSDSDKKPDINVVSLTKWEPNSTCSIIDGVQYETMLDLQPVINIDVDGDGIPDLNIDNDGDLKGDLNISKDGKTPSINITTIHAWDPHTDYTHAGFTYDSIGTKADDPKPELNIDSDEDGRPDINIDLDEDGRPDINIDLDKDGIPDIDIDSDGDGIGDVNVDTDGDGKADENLVDIPEWKPEMNVDGEFPYDTMPNLKPKEDHELEDGGIIVEDPDGTFTSEYQLKVEVVTDTISNVVKEAIGKHVDIDQEIKEVYDVILLKDNVRVQPDGVLKIKIPVNEAYTSVKILVEQADGTFQEIAVVMEDGYYVFESAYLGKVSIVADQVQETHNNSAVGGASTGYEEWIIPYILMMLLSSLLVVYSYKKAV